MYLTLVIITSRDRLCVFSSLQLFTMCSQHQASSRSFAMTVRSKSNWLQF